MRENNTIHPKMFIFTIIFGNYFFYRVRCFFKFWCQIFRFLYFESTFYPLDLLSLLLIYFRNVPKSLFAPQEEQLCYLSLCFEPKAVFVGLHNSLYLCGILKCSIVTYLFHPGDIFSELLDVLLRLYYALFDFLNVLRKWVV